MSTGNNRVHDKLRSMIDRACEGIMPHIAERIQDAARRAYYLGCEDGMAMMERDTKEQNHG